MAERQPVMFQGEEVTHDLLARLWTTNVPSRVNSRYRITLCQGLRRKTLKVQLAQTWADRHPDAASWVVKVLPERRTLERDLIAAAGAVEPTISRVAIGDRARDADDAEACESYLETWRKENVPHQTFIEKDAEDGEHGLVVIPTAVDMEGCPDFYDRLDQRAYAALDDEQRAAYATEPDAAGKHPKRTPDGSPGYNPTYTRDAAGKTRATAARDFTRDPDKSKEAHDRAVQRYLLKQEQGGVTVRLIPALDCIPFLTRGTKRERWKLHALLERTLYYPEELLGKGYGWRGMGDRALIPRGFEATRTTGQAGMFYLYTLYLVDEQRQADRVIRRPLVLYSVAGTPTYHERPSKGQENTEGQVALIDLYDQFGLEGPFWWYGGGMHTADDSSDFYWEPVLWPVAETILGIEGTTTSINAATSVNAFTGHFHKPDADLVGAEGVDPEALLDASTGELRQPKIPAAGEIETVVGEVFPALPATVSPDAWRVAQNEMLSLKENMSLTPTAGAGDSGHKLVVAETLAQTAKRHIREGALDATRFSVVAAFKIFHALSVTYGVNWPIQATKERPVGSELRASGDVLAFDPAWAGDGEYQITAAYPEEGNLAQVEQEASLAERGFGSFEDVQAARGKSDAETEWARVLKWRIRQQPAYIEAQTTRLAKLQGNALMLQVLKLQADQRLTKQGAPGFEGGLPTAALNGPGQGGPPSSGPTAAQQSLAGSISGEKGTASRMADAQSQLQIAPPQPEAA